MTLKPKNPERGPRILTVKEATYLTPNMVRVTFSGDELSGIPADRSGGNCKVMIPDLGLSREEFAEQLTNGPKPKTRTYTVRSFRQSPMEMDIDFVAHGDSGPASRWASNAKPGDFCGFAGPSMPKLTEFYSDWYLLAGDMSALPVVSATLEAMPEDARGVAILEVISAEDVQHITAPDGIDVHWLVIDDPNKTSDKQEQFIRNLKWPRGSIQTCIAGESSVIRSLRHFLHNEKEISKKDTYISGYWKIGLVEDEHQIAKRAEEST